MKQIFRKVPSKISTIMVAFDAGARAEGNKYSFGLAHCLEHLIFKGTAKRHCLEIPKEIGFLGADFNAFTSQEMVAFHISVPYEHTEKAIEILTDLLFNSIFPEEEVIKEMEVIKEEELSSDESVDSFIYDKFSEEFFGGRLKSPVIGTQETIGKITLDEIKSFYQLHYTKPNALVALCSNHSKSDGKRLLKKYFGSSKKKSIPAPPMETPTYKASRTMTITRPELEQAHVWVCYPGSPIGAPGEVAEEMLLGILGQGMDSRLFTEVREKRGLCYGIGSFALGHRDYSAVIISVVTRLENVDEVLRLIDTEVQKVKTDLVEEEELERARNKYRAEKYVLMERSYSLAKTELSRAFFDLSSLEELEKEFNTVTRQELLSAAQGIFDDTRKLILICKEGNEE